MSSEPWSDQASIPSLAADDFFLVVDVSLPQANRTVTATQVLDFIEGNLNSLDNNLDMGGGNITNVVHIRGQATGTTLSIRDNLNDVLLNLNSSSDPMNFLFFETSNTGSFPPIQSRGADDDIDIRLNAKGTGEIKIIQDSKTDGSLIVDKRLKLTQPASAVSSTGNLTLSQGNVFEIDGTMNIARMENTDWPNGSIVVLHLIDASTVQDAQGNAPPYRQFLTDGDLSGPAVLTVYLKNDGWNEMSRTEL